MDIPYVEFHSNTDAQTLVEVVELDSLVRRKHQFDHNPEKPHRVAFYILLYIESGTGVHFLDFHHRPFQAGSVLFIQQNQIHAFDLSNRPTGKMILFTQPFIQTIQRNMRLPMFGPAYLLQDYHPILQLSGAMQESFHHLLGEMDKEVQKGDGHSLIIMHLFSSLLLMTWREMQLGFSRDMGIKRQEKLMAFFELLQHHFTHTRHAADYASMLHITYKTLNQLCKQETGKTAKQLIDAYTILEAKRRLTVDKMPIQALSNDLGFDEVTNFVKYFKKHTLVTPSDFKKQ